MLIERNNYSNLVKPIQVSPYLGLYELQHTPSRIYLQRNKAGIPYSLQLMARTKNSLETPRRASYIYLFTGFNKLQFSI
jgi:hypothetical protein